MFDTGQSLFTGMQTHQMPATKDLEDAAIECNDDIKYHESADFNFPLSPGVRLPSRMWRQSTRSSGDTKSPKAAAKD